MASSLDHNAPNIFRACVLSRPLSSMAKKVSARSPKTKSKVKSAKVITVSSKKVEGDKSAVDTDALPAPSSGKAISGKENMEVCHARPGDFRIMSWNVNGLRALLKKEGRLQEVVADADPDVVCLQETKIDDSVVSTFQTRSNPFAKETSSAILPGYFCYWNCCKTKKGYSGTAMFTKRRPLSVSMEMGAAAHEQEGRYIHAEFEDLHLVNTYVPNAGQKLDRLSYRTQEWDPALRGRVKELAASKPVVWTGDLNCAHQEIDIHNPKGNRRSAGFTDEERESFSQTLSSTSSSSSEPEPGLGLVDSFRHLHPSTQRFSYFSYRGNAKARNMGWRLDYFLLSPSLLPRLRASEIRSEVDGSDHVPILLTLQPPAEQEPQGGGGEENQAE